MATAIDKQRVSITAVWLRREGERAIVALEISGQWVDVISEFIDSPFSHIVEYGGIEREYNRYINSLARKRELK